MTAILTPGTWYFPIRAASVKPVTGLPLIRTAGTNPCSTASIRCSSGEVGRGAAAGGCATEGRPREEGAWMSPLAINGTLEQANSARIPVADTGTDRTMGNPLGDLRSGERGRLAG